MPLTLEQYAAELMTRDLVWPAAPPPVPVKAKPHVTSLPQIKVVAWNVYGTLLSISTGSLVFQHPQKLIFDLALDKTIQEFKMWGSMSRKPGQPSEYMGQLFQRALDQLKLAPSHGEKFPEIASERIWDDIVKKLQQKDYKYDAGLLGGIGELTKKIAYFFHASMQGTGLYPNAIRALGHLSSCGIRQGLLSDGQCFTLAQFNRALETEGAGTADDYFDRGLRSLSHDVGGRKPSERLFKHFLASAARHGVEPMQVLHIGSRIIEDIAPAKKLGMRTALFAGDKESLAASADQLRDVATRPDLLLTDLGQIAEAIGSS